MTTKICLRRYKLDDVDAIFDAVMESKSDLSRWMPWCHAGYSRDDVVSWVEGRPNAWETNQEWGFVIVDCDDELLGTCGIHRIDILNGVGEVGYWIRTSATGRGIATEATRQLCDWAFKEKNLRRIEILVAVENLASQRVAEKAGGVREGVLRQRFLLHDRRHDCALFSILNED